MNNSLLKLILDTLNLEHTASNIELVTNISLVVVDICEQYVEDHYDECEPWMNPNDLNRMFGFNFTHNSLDTTINQ